MDLRPILCNPPEHLSLKEHAITYPPDYESNLLDYNVYHYGKGGVWDIVHELTSGIQGTCPMAVTQPALIDETFNVMEKTWMVYGGVSDPLSWEEAILLKEEGTSTGYPMNAYFSNFGDMLKEIGLPKLVEMCEEAEQLIMQGKAPVNLWRPFPKLDKYSSGKVASGKFRVVSTGSFFLLTLCRRWYSQVEENLKRSINQIFTITTNDLFHDKVVQRMCDGFTFGIDYSSFDKNSCSYFVLKSIELLHRLSKRSVPHPIFEYITLSICQPLSLIIAPNGDQLVYIMPGTNPSGQFFTSWTNSVSHLAHNMLFVQERLHERQDDYLYDYASLLSVCTGDDGVERFDTEEHGLTKAKLLALFIETSFAIPCKLDLMKTRDGYALYPQSLMAPYLNRILVLPTNRTYYQFPLNPKRLLPKLIFKVQGEIKGDINEIMTERAAGILNELQGLLYHEFVNPALPRNRILSEIVKTAEKMGVRPSPPQKISGVLWGIADKMI